MGTTPRRVELLVEPRTHHGRRRRAPAPLHRRPGPGPCDPFLLLDDFGSDDPADYLPGFPMHPHRGIETVTYLLGGEVDHRDTLGNAGTIGGRRRAVDDLRRRHHA